MDPGGRSMEDRSPAALPHLYDDQHRPRASLALFECDPLRDVRHRHALTAQFDEALHVTPRPGQHCDAFPATDHLHT
jgi:hypothetical protein